MSVGENPGGNKRTQSLEFPRRRRKRHLLTEFMKTLKKRKKKFIVINILGNYSCNKITPTGVEVRQNEIEENTVHLVLPPSTGLQGTKGTGMSKGEVCDYQKVGQSSGDGPSTGNLRPGPGE